MDESDELEAPDLFSERVKLNDDEHKKYFIPQLDLSKAKKI